MCIIFNKITKCIKKTFIKLKNCCKKLYIRYKLRKIRYKNI